ncbi:MAG: archease [Acidimicrobiia bacterium]|nr:archease [Acidimicrobiia bacterium]
MPYTVLSHTADAGIEATASTLSELLCELATGMFSLMGSLEPCAQTQAVEVDVASTSRDELVVDVLSELLYHSEVEDLFLCSFEARTSEPHRVHMRAGGVPNSAVKLSGAPIKAVTYHDVAVHETADGWYGRVYLDV